MTVNEAIRIMKARAPVEVCGNLVWKVGSLRFTRIESITHKVTDKGKMYIYASCVDGNAPNCLVAVGLGDIQLAPDCPEILRKTIYKDDTKPAEEAPLKPAESIFISIILNDKSYFDIPVSKVEKWKEIYPAVDVEQELREMSDWAESNPTRRKTKKGILTFIRNWLSKEQDKGGSQSKRYVKNDDAERSFDIDEFDRFTLGIG